MHTRTQLSNYIAEAVFATADHVSYIFLVTFIAPLRLCAAQSKLGHHNADSSGNVF